MQALLDSKNGENGVDDMNLNQPGIGFGSENYGSMIGSIDVFRRYQLLTQDCPVPSWASVVWVNTCWTSSFLLFDLSQAFRVAASWCLAVLKSQWYNFNLKIINIRSSIWSQ
jgi:hypothetical protein